MKDSPCVGNISYLKESCIFCNSSKQDEEQYGKWIGNEQFVTHYFCMLFASGLSQSGKSDEDGLLGFLPVDIIKEVKRGQKLKCSCCKKKGATIGCNVKACQKSYHFDCGRQNGALNQFFGTYATYCDDHRPQQQVPVGERLSFHAATNSTCAICYCTLEARPSNDTLRVPCCQNAWFHTECIQKQATSAGLYFFKCPLCNNKDIFQDEMLKFGIHIPDQDAAWEREPNAFQELLQRHCRCDSAECICSRGREYNKDGSKWEIILCDHCGHTGTHIECASAIDKEKLDWICPSCTHIHNRTPGYPIPGPSKEPSCQPTVQQNKISPKKMKKRKRKRSEGDNESVNFTKFKKTRRKVGYMNSKPCHKTLKHIYYKKKATVQKDTEQKKSENSVSMQTRVTRRSSVSFPSPKRTRKDFHDWPLALPKMNQELAQLKIDMTPKHNFSDVQIKCGILKDRNIQDVLCLDTRESTNNDTFQAFTLDKLEANKSGLYVCDICSRCFLTSRLCRIHFFHCHINLKYVSKADMLALEICHSKEAGDDWEYDEDEQHDDEIPGVFICRPCRTKFKIKESLQHHLLNHHNTPVLQSNTKEGKSKHKMTLTQNVISENAAKDAVSAITDVDGNSQSSCSCTESKIHLLMEYETDESDSCTLQDKTDTYNNNSGESSSLLDPTSSPETQNENDQRCSPESSVPREGSVRRNEHQRMPNYIFSVSKMSSMQKMDQIVHSFVEKVMQNKESHLVDVENEEIVVSFHMEKEIVKVSGAIISNDMLRWLQRAFYNIPNSNETNTRMNPDLPVIEWEQNPKKITQSSGTSKVIDLCD